VQRPKPQRDADSIVLHTVFAVVRRGIVCGCPLCGQQAADMLQWYIGPDLNPALEQELYGLLRAHIARWS
jgi:hypothetical protein